MKLSVWKSFVTRYTRGLDNTVELPRDLARRFFSSNDLKKKQDSRCPKPLGESKLRARLLQASAPERIGRRQNLSEQLQIQKLPVSLWSVQHRSQMRLQVAQHYWKTHPKIYSANESFQAEQRPETAVAAR